MKTSDKGLLPNDHRTKDYILFSKGRAGVPERFHDHALINTTRPYDKEKWIKSGFYLNDLTRVINRFGGISFEYLVN